MNIEPTYEGATIGLVVEGNAYFCDLTRYRAMDRAELLIERSELRAARRATWKAFLRHRAVLWYGASALFFLAVLLATWQDLTGVMWVAAAATAVMVSAYWMKHARESYFDGLKLLDAQIRVLDACLANQAAWAAYGAPPSLEKCS